MNRNASRRQQWLLAGCIVLSSALAMAGCTQKTEPPQTQPPATTVPPTTKPGDSLLTPPPTQTNNNGKTNEDKTAQLDDKQKPNDNQQPDKQPKNPDPKTAQVVAKPDSIAVLINKTYALPNDYRPDDLVEPDIPFIFSEKNDKRLLRKEAAEALEKLVAAAKKDGVLLAGVSGFRSQKTQTSLFNNYVKRDGEEAARKYSAVPGHSEHQTGLAIDMSGTNGKCAAEDCFAGTKEAIWMEKHSAEYGFIIRYPKDKDDVTGYQYEPWHIRYVGVEMAKDIAKQGLTLEEYQNNAVSAAGKK